VVMRSIASKTEPYERLSPLPPKGHKQYNLTPQKSFPQQYRTIKQIKGIR